MAHQLCEQLVSCYYTLIVTYTIEIVYELKTFKVDASKSDTIKKTLDHNREIKPYEITINLILRVFTTR